MHPFAGVDILIHMLTFETSCFLFFSLKAEPLAWFCLIRGNNADTVKIGSCSNFGNSNNNIYRLKRNNTETLNHEMFLYFANYDQFVLKSLMFF